MDKPFFDTVPLAHTITRQGSKQSYYSARFLADKECVNDAIKAYAYFRWVDDYVDDVSGSTAERMAFIERQSDLIRRAYSNGTILDLEPQEQMIVELITKDHSTSSKLQSYIHNMFAIIRFDAERRGRYISEGELSWYSSSLGKAVIDNLQYFIGKGYPYPISRDQYLSAMGAHVAHMLRDMVVDLHGGYINIPKEYLEEHRILPDEFSNPYLRAWVRSRVNLARRYFQQGKRYFSQIPILRYKLVCYLYCARYDGLLRRIELDDFQLQESYTERYKPTSLLRIAGLMSVVTMSHLFNHGSRRRFVKPESPN